MCIIKPDGSTAYTPASVFQYMENWDALPAEAKNNLHNDYKEESISIFIKGKVPNLRLGIIWKQQFRFLGAGGYNFTLTSMAKDCRSYSTHKCL